MNNECELKMIEQLSKENAQLKKAGGYKNENFNHPMSREQSDNIIKYFWIRAFIFDHEFAKAFWGEDRLKCNNCNKEYLELENFLQHIGGTSVCSDSYETIDGWVHHLQQMVLQTEPLKYLEKFL